MIEQLEFMTWAVQLKMPRSDNTLDIKWIFRILNNKFYSLNFLNLKDAINVLKFSTCGRYLASGGSDSCIFLWDISTSVIVANFQSHRDSVYCLEFSRDNSVLASGGLDNTIKVWNMTKLCKDVEQSEDLSKFTTRTEAQLEIGSWQTKLTPIMHLHFTRRNLLVGIGPFREKN